MEDFFKFCGLMFLFFALCIALMVALFYVANLSQSKNLREVIGAETYSSLSTGCLIKQQGKWMDCDAYLRNNSELKITH